MANKNESKKAHLKCPYCDEEVAELQYPYCDVCKVEFSVCPKCGKPVSKGSDNCPACGAEITCK